MTLPFTITGTVIHGNSLGNTIDVPTANIIPNEDVTGLNMGVYRSFTLIDKKRYDAITNLGVKPTVSDGKRVSAESFVKGEEKCASPAPVGSCISRLYEEGGKVLLIGVGHERNTFLHSVDERLNIPDRLNPDPFVITIINHEGKQMKSPPFHSHFTAASDCCVSEYYPNYKEALEYKGAVAYSKLGNAMVYVCDCIKMTDTLKTIWERADRDLCLSAEPIPKELYE